MLRICFKTGSLTIPFPVVLLLFTAIFNLNTKWTKKKEKKKRKESAEIFAAL
jgi:hypothetical protein